MTEQAKTETIEQRITPIIEHLRKLIQGDGGDIELVNVDEGTGVVSIRFHGACVGCPSASMTLSMGVERNLKEKVPEVTKVVAVQ